MISIIIPTYNSAGTITKTLDSIFNQTFKDFEVIVVNDGSTDGTAEVLAVWRAANKSKSIKLINQENRGRNPARNRGANEAQGQYFLFCDSDIVMKPEMLEKMVKTLEANPRKSYVYSSFRFGWKLFRLWPFNIERLKQMPYIHTTALIRREHFPGFDEKIKKFQDWDLWLTMLEQGHEGIWLPEVLFKVYTQKDGLSSWLPKFFYRIPWKKLGIRIKAIEKYEKAREIIKKKHQLD